MSNQILKLRRSSVPGKVPTTSSLDFGEIALNTYDGLAFMKKSGSNGEEIVTIGSTSGSFTGSLFGTASYSLFAISSSYSTNIGGEPFYIAVFNGTNQLTSSTIYQSASFTSIRNVTTPTDPTNPDILYVDGTGIATRNIIAAHSNENQYIQMYIQNFNNSGDASSDVVASADNATESEYYIDMGINSSGYTNTSVVGTQNDAYVYSTGNNLLIGNGSINRKIIIFNGGLDAEANARIYVHEQGTVTVNTNTYNPTNPPSLQVQALDETIFNLISAYGSTDNYLENNIVNANIGTTASADFVAYNDLDPSNQEFGYVDMGINSTNYIPGPDYPGAAGDAYLYTDSHHLILGATSASGDTKVSLFAGGASEADNSKLILYGNNQHQMTGSLDMTGSLIVTDGITGSLYGTASWALNTLTASYVKNAVSASFATNAATASSANDFIVRGSLTGSDALFTGTITAQRLNVQYITASTEFITGSTKFGTQLTDTHQFTGSVSITGSLTVNGTINATSSWAQNATTASFVTASNVYGPFGSNSIISSSYALTASFALNAGGASAAVTNQIATGSVTASVNINSASFQLTSASVQLLFVSNSGLITGQRMFLSASQNTLSGSTLTLYGSGSAQPVFTVQGSQGELFSVTDSLSGSLFSVNDISGLPIVEVFSDNRTLIGSYQAPALITTVRTTSAIGNNIIYQNLPTSSYDGAFFDYTLKSGSNARAGQITAIWSGSSVNFTETTTTDFGDTSGVKFMVMITGSNMALTGSFPSASWTVKTIIRSI